MTSFTVTVGADAFSTASLIVAHDQDSSRSYKVTGPPAGVIINAANPGELLDAAMRLTELAVEWRTDLLRATMAPLPETAAP